MNNYSTQHYHAKRKYEQAVQSQMLTNYYLSKYQRYMANQTQPNIPTNTINSHQLSRDTYNLYSTSKQNNNSRRKNFKAAIMARKYQTHLNSSLQRKQGAPRGSDRSPIKSHSSNRRNFKEQVQLKNSRKKQSKKNNENFKKLESSIINELYSPSPSKLESGAFHSIQIEHKTSYDTEHNRELTTPFMIYEKEEEDNIHIFKDQEQDFEVIEEHSEYPQKMIANNTDSYYEINSSRERDQLSRIQEGIKYSFERRNSKNKKGQESPKKLRIKNIAEHIDDASISSKNKFPPKYSSPKSIEKERNSRTFEKREEKNENNQSLFYENIRPGFFDLKKQQDSLNSTNKNRKYSYEKQSKETKKYYSAQSEILGHPFNHSRASIPRQDPAPSHKSKATSRSKKKSDNSYEDSINQIVHQIDSNQDKIPSLYSPQSHNSNRKERSGSVDKPSTQLRQSLHQLSMISRFSMTSDEGGYIREHLERQLNENQFGPYQQALTNLKELIDEFPHAWPIFVVGQRILEDREQYDMKRSVQNEEIKHLENRIINIKEKIRKRQQHSTDIDNNSRTILYLTRRLAEELDNE